MTSHSRTHLCWISIKLPVQTLVLNNKEGKSWGLMVEVVDNSK
jgi:hypothetical protein